MARFDIHIKNGTIVDGARTPRYQGDMWIKDGRIAQLGGKAEGDAARVIDATDRIVAPGFVDLHTHYDAQIRWDPWCTISGWHGVTSVVLGNCGFGFAPVKPDFRERSMLTMTRTNIEYDFPAGEWRRVQRAIGYDAIIVNGEITFEQGECTGATPGKLLRHGQDTGA